MILAGYTIPYIPDNLAISMLNDWIDFAISLVRYPKSRQSGSFGVAPSGSLCLALSDGS